MNNRETSVKSLALLVSMLSIQGVTQIDTDFGMVWGGDKESVLYGRICVIHPSEGVGVMTLDGKGT